MEESKVKTLIAMFDKTSYQKDLNKAKSLSKKESLKFIENPEWAFDDRDQGFRPEGSKRMCYLYEPSSEIPFAVFCENGFYEIEFSNEFPDGKGVLLLKYED